MPTMGELVRVRVGMGLVNAMVGRDRGPVVLVRGGAIRVVLVDGRGVARGVARGVHRRVRVGRAVGEGGRLVVRGGCGGVRGGGGGVHGAVAERVRPVVVRVVRARGNVRVLHVPRGQRVARGLLFFVLLFLEVLIT